MTPEQARGLITERFGVPVEGAGAELAVTVPTDRWVECARVARDELGCRFFNFSTAVDWKDEGLEVVARVDDVETGLGLLLKTRLGPGETRCPSLVPVYRGAEWSERECYDLFGVRFEGHPDLRRILLPQDWEGHPLLKSYAVDTPHPPYR